MATALPFIMAGATLLQGIQQFQAAGAEGDAAQAQADFETQQLETQIERDKAQAAIESRNREERLRRTLARQRALFGSSSVDEGSGTAIKLQEDAISSINREQGIEDFNTAQNILNLNIQQEQVGIANVAKQNVASGKQFSAITGTVVNSGKILQGSSLLNGE